MSLQGRDVGWSPQECSSSSRWYAFANCSFSLPKLSLNCHTNVKGQDEEVSGKMEKNGKERKDTQFMSGNYLPVIVCSNILLHSIMFAFLLPLRWEEYSFPKVILTHQVKKKGAGVWQYCLSEYYYTGNYDLFHL